MTDPRKHPRLQAQSLLPEADDPQARRIAIARLRDMSREERLALLMRNFSLDCGEALGMPRRGAPAPRKQQSAPQSCERARKSPKG